MASNKGKRFYAFKKENGIEEQFEEAQRVMFGPASSLVSDIDTFRAMLRLINQYGAEIIEQHPDWLVEPEVQ